MNFYPHFPHLLFYLNKILYNKPVHNAAKHLSVH